MEPSRRRQDLGEKPSAALPLLWEEAARRGLSHAQIAAALQEDGGKIARLLYGDRKPGRALAKKLLDVFNVPIEAWDEPLPRGWKPSHEHRAA